MILVDSSVWIDYFNGSATPETERLDGLLATDVVATGDLILAEVLQGFREDVHFAAAKRALATLPAFDLLGRERAYGAADRYRELRKAGHHSAQDRRLDHRLVLHRRRFAVAVRGPGLPPDGGATGAATGTARALGELATAIGSHGEVDAVLGKRWRTGVPRGRSRHRRPRALRSDSPRPLPA